MATKSRVHQPEGVTNSSDEGSNRIVTGKQTKRNIMGFVLKKRGRSNDKEKLHRK
jgi:hypothetical protein